MTNPALAPIIGHAFVRSPIAPMFSEPRVSSAQTSQVLAGHPVYVLESRADHWHRVRSMDAYDGWMHDGYFMRMLDDAPVISTTSEDFALTYVPRVSMGVIARSERHGVRALPLAAWLDLDEEVLEGETIPLNQLEEHFPAEPDAIAQSSVEWFEGASYQWGGVTPWGADCSGFLQTIFGLHGVSLPRDAYLQARVGAEVARTSLQPADLLFFSDREDKRITHVGLALAGDRLAHIAIGRGGYAMEWLGDTDDSYVATLNARFVTARRVV
jgi:gamma-D-glutamyl-L-lysine dipeptidyl-peptidase